MQLKPELRIALSKYYKNKINDNADIKFTRLQCMAKLFCLAQFIHGDW